MSEKAEIPEELVGEIADTIGSKAMMRLDGFEAYQPMAGIYEAERRQRILAEELIARIGHAILSGKYPELDKILGVRGRIEIIPPKKGRRWIDLGYQAFLDELRVGDTLIALRRLTGTGLEEAIANLEAHSERLEEFIALRLQAPPGEEGGE